jgi:hypothetical protein
MPPSTVLVINSLLPQLTDWLESIMFSLELVLLSYKVMIMKYPKSNLTHKEIRLSRQVATKRAESGTLIRDKRSRCSMDTKTKYSHALSITRVTP